MDRNHQPEERAVGETAPSVGPGAEEQQFIRFPVAAPEEEEPAPEAGSASAEQLRQAAAEVLDRRAEGKEASVAVGAGPPGPSEATAEPVVGPPAEAPAGALESGELPAEVPVLPKSILEALLFVGGSPLSVDEAVELIQGITPNDVREMVDELNEAYREEGLPFEIAEDKRGLVMQVNDQYLPILRRLYARRRQAGLSKASLETLALVAYRQPISRQEIENIRGTASGPVLRSLISRGLVRGVDHVEGGVRSLRYVTTQRFLEQFHLASIADLPRIEDIEKL